MMAFYALDNIPKMPSAENDHSIQRLPRFPNKALGISVAHGRPAMRQCVDVSKHFSVCCKKCLCRIWKFSEKRTAPNPHCRIHSAVPCKKRFGANDCHDLVEQVLDWHAVFDQGAAVVFGEADAGGEFSAEDAAFGYQIIVYQERFRINKLSYFIGEMMGGIGGHGCVLSGKWVRRIYAVHSR